MPRIAKFILIICGLWASLASAAPAVALSQEQVLKLRDIQISLPASWVRLPNTEIAALHKRSLARQGKAMSYAYGFQEANNGKWFSLPYMLIRYHRGGAWTEKEIAEIDSEFEAAMRRGNARFSKLLNSAASAKGVFDAQTNTAWTKFSLNLKGVGPVSGLSAVRLTNYGYIQILGYSTTADFEKNAATFRHVVDSSVLDENVRYNLPGTANASSKDYAGTVSPNEILTKVIAAFVMLALFLAFRRLWKQATDSENLKETI